MLTIKILGDIRKKGFEDTGKVDKIFEGSYQYLKQLYDPVIQNADWLEVSADGSIYKVWMIKNDSLKINLFFTWLLRISAPKHWLNRYYYYLRRCKCNRRRTKIWRQRFLELFLLLQNHKRGLIFGQPVQYDQQNMDWQKLKSSLKVWNNNTNIMKSSKSQKFKF